MTSWEKFKELGNEEYKKKNYNAAISLYTDGIRENPEVDVLYSNRALCHKALNNYRNALSDLDKALNISPTNIKNLKRKAECLVITGNIAEAISIYQKCCNLEPKNTQNLLDLSHAKANLVNLNSFHDAYSKEDYTKAEELGKKLLEICSASKDLKISYIECLINNNKLTDAASFWSTKLSENERVEDEFLYLICKIFYYEGNYERARNFLKKLLNKVNDNSKYNKLFHMVNSIEKEKENANAIFKEGKYKEAIDAYTKILEIDPNNKIFNSTIIANRALCK